MKHSQKIYPVQNTRISNGVKWGSIAVSLDELSLAERLFLAGSIVAVLIFTFPQVALAQVSPPFVFEVNPQHLNTYLIQEKDRILTVASETNPEELQIIILPAPDPRLEILESYLASKNSPMAAHAEALLAQKHYAFIVAISFAESNFCKINIRPHNCWGIGGTYPEIYKDYPAAFERADELIEKYHQQGMTSPRLMRNTWVGWQNDSWIVAVNQVISELRGLGL